MICWFYKWLPIIFGCHCMESRSFHYKGKKFPICARCFGELMGIVFGILTFAFFSVSGWVALILMLPMLFDGFLQSLTKYESNNIKRCITGFLFGYGIITLFIISSLWVMSKGYTLGNNIG